MEPHFGPPSPLSTSPGRAACLAVAWLTCAVLSGAQEVTVNTVGDVVKVHAPALAFLSGEPLARLKDGGAVRVELSLVVLAAPGRSSVAGTRQTFAVSYDLWEERFAVTTEGAPARSISHLAPVAAEAWCVDQLGISIRSLDGLGRDARFWIRLEYRILDGDATPAGADEEGFTLQGLIDRLSRRRKTEAPARSIEAGPFRLPPRAAGSPPR